MSSKDGPTQTQQTQAQTVTQPWAPTQGALQGILGQINGQTSNTAVTPTETNAFNSIQANAAAGNQYLPGVTSATNNLLSGGPDLTAAPQAAYSQYSSQVMPWANGSMGDPSQNPALASMLSTIQGDTQNSVNGMFAGAGRSFSGENQQALARGLAQGEAPTLLNAQTQGLQAAQNLYNAGNSTTGVLSGLDQNTLNNQQAGIAAAPDALAAQNYGSNLALQTSAAQRALPLSNIANLNSLLLPIAGLGGQSNSTGTTTQQTQIPTWQAILGGLSGGAGALGATGAFPSGTGSNASAGWLGPALKAGVGAFGL